MAASRPNPSGDRANLFRVGDQDFNLLFGRLSGLHINHEVRANGVFIILPEYGDMLEPEELQLFLHPTGNRDEPILPFPCSLDELMQFFPREEYGGKPAPELLVKWMSGRVDILRRRHGCEWLDAIADTLFLVHDEDLSMLLPEIDGTLTQPECPCSLLELLIWCDGDDIGETRSGQPKSASIVQLIENRLLAGFTSDGREMNAREKNSRLNIIVALSIDAKIVSLKDWESASRDALNARIAQLMKLTNIPIDKGKGAALKVESAVRRAQEGGDLLEFTPRVKTIRAILNELAETENVITR
jgi:hypothetical protein